MSAGHIPFIYRPQLHCFCCHRPRLPGAVTRSGGRPQSLEAPFTVPGQQVVVANHCPEAPGETM